MEITINVPRLFIISIILIALSSISFATVSRSECPSTPFHCPVESLCGHLESNSAGGAWGMPYLELSGGEGVAGRFCDHYVEYSTATMYERCGTSLSRLMEFTTEEVGEYGAFPVYIFANVSGAGEETKVGQTAGNCFFVYWGLGCESELIGSSDCPRCVVGVGGVSGRFVHTDTSLVGDHINIISGTIVSMDLEDTYSEISAISQQYEINPYAVYELDTLKFSFVKGDGSTHKVNISIPEQCIPTLGEAPGTECTAVANCPTGEICIYGRCVGEKATKCGISNPCPIGMECSYFRCVERMPPVGVWTETTQNGTAKIQITNGGIITINGRSVQTITGAEANIVITKNGVMINGHLLTAEEGVLVVDIFDLPKSGGIVSTALGDDLVVFVNSTTALVFNRYILNLRYVGSECKNDCESGDECCDGECVDLTMDWFNCGVCGNMCTADQSCSEGICRDSQEVVDEFNDKSRKALNETFKYEDDTSNPGGNAEPDFFTGFINWLLGLFGLKW